MNHTVQQLLIHSMHRHPRPVFVTGQPVTAANNMTRHSTKQTLTQRLECLQMQPVYYNVFGLNHATDIQHLQYPPG
jgi:hypothetical protein